MRCDIMQVRAQGDGSKESENDGLWGASENRVFGLPVGIILLLALFAASGYTFMTTSMNL